jgi:hypothetical protein
MNTSGILREVPPKVRKRLNLPEPDEGIDLIAETKRGNYWAIQYREWEPLEGGTDACANESAIGRNFIIFLTEKLRRRE